MRTVITFVKMWLDREKVIDKSHGQLPTIHHKINHPSQKRTQSKVLKFQITTTKSSSSFLRSKKFWPTQKLLVFS